MPAKNLSEIYNFNEACDRAVASALKAVGVVPMIVRETEDLEDTYIVPSLTVGPASGHLGIRGDGAREYDLFQDCLVEIALETRRVSNEQPILTGVYTLFAEQCARIRLGLTFARLDYLNSFLPFHHITKLKPAGTVMGFDPASGNDRAAIRYQCWFGIRPDGWPTDPLAYTAVG